MFLAVSSQEVTLNYCLSPKMAPQKGDKGFNTSHLKVLPGGHQHLLLRDGTEGGRREVMGTVASEVVARRIVEDQLAGEETLETRCPCFHRVFSNFLLQIKD